MTSPDKKPRTSATTSRKALYVIAGGAALIAASFSVQAIADNKYVQHAVVEAQAANPFTQKAHWGGRGERRGGWFGGQRVRFSEMSDEQVERRVNRMVRHASIEIDATKEQEEKITALVTAVAKDMRSVRTEWRAVGMDMLDTLTATTVDRAKLETLRAARIADADARSKQVVNALADVSAVLTAEQRTTLKERIKDFRAMGGRRGWRHGGRG
ncbi:MAG: Spy/CpxP family protein refolding chaperone [Pseudomonadota bacterium]